MDKDKKERFPLYEAFGRRDSLKGFARWSGVADSTLRNRLLRGMTLEQAMMSPVENKGMRVSHNKTQKQIAEIEAQLNPTPPAINLERLITKRSQNKSPHKDTLIFYNGEVMDIIPKGGRIYDVDVLFRGSSSCVYYRTMKGINEVELAELLKRLDVLRIELRRERVCRM